MMTTNQIKNQPTAFPIAEIRTNFPILQRTIRGKPLVYLDNTATTQKPRAVMNALAEYYYGNNANVHRGIHWLSESATQAYEQARRTVQKFIYAGDSNEIVFVRGTTEAINLVAQTFGKLQVKANDEIIISMMEHHSNWVPWQVLAEQTGAQLKIAPINNAGELIVSELVAMMTPRTRLLALSHVSNVLGTINPIQEIIALAHARNIPVLIDGAQAVPHMPVNVQELDCDFYAFSGHKTYAPTGIGVLYGKKQWLTVMPPYQTGGGMITEVSLPQTSYQNGAEKFEAGTPDIAGAIGLGAALDYLGAIGMENVKQYENDLLHYAMEKLIAVPGLRIIGTASAKAAVISFVLAGVHPHDVGTVLDSEGIAVRAGHHCAMPLMEHFQLPATVRVSLGIYNTKVEIDQLVQALIKTNKMFG